MKGKFLGRSGSIGFFLPCIFTQQSRRKWPGHMDHISWTGFTYILVSTVLGLLSFSSVMVQVLPSDLKESLGGWEQLISSGDGGGSFMGMDFWLGETIIFYLAPAVTIIKNQRYKLDRALCISIVITTAVNAPFVLSEEKLHTWTCKEAGRVLPDDVNWRCPFLFVFLTAFTALRLFKLFFILSAFQLYDQLKGKVCHNVPSTVTFQ